METRVWTIDMLCVQKFRVISSHYYLHEFGSHNAIIAHQLR